MIKEITFAIFMTWFDHFVSNTLLSTGYVGIGPKWFNTLSTRRIYSNIGTNPYQNRYEFKFTLIRFQENQKEIIEKVQIFVLKKKFNTNVTVISNALTSKDVSLHLMNKEHFKEKYSPLCKWFNVLFFSKVRSSD